MPIRSPLRNVRKMSIIFMNCSHSLAVREAWIDCFFRAFKLFSLDMHASSEVTFPVNTSLEPLNYSHRADFQLLQDLSVVSHFHEAYASAARIHDMHAFQVQVKPRGS